MTDQASDNKRRAAVFVAVMVVAAAVVLGGIGILVLGWLGLAVGLVLAVAAVWFALRGVEARVAGRIGGRSADPVAHARLHNLVEGLCVAGGLPKPELVVVDDLAPNALAFGRDPRRATVVVTEGLLEGMTRIELEGVLAHELSHVKSLDIRPATLGAAFNVPDLLRRGNGDDGAQEALADLQAVGLTRYPPGLLSALEKIKADQTPMTPRSASVASLWLKPPTTGDQPPLPLDERIETLREL